MEEHGHKPEEKPHGEKKSGFVSPVPSWAWLLLISICLSIVIFAFINKAVSNRKDKPRSGRVEKKGNERIFRTRWIKDEKITVYYTNEYINTVHLPRGRGVSFEGSSEPYCVKTASGFETCGKEGEDVSPKVPSARSSFTLMFKSSNGKDGKISVIMWVKVEEEVAH